MIAPALTALAHALVGAAAIATALGLLPLLLVLASVPGAAGGALVPPSRPWPSPHPAFSPRACRWRTAQPLRHPQHRRLDVWEERVLPPLRPTNGTTAGSGAGHK